MSRLAGRIHAVLVAVSLAGCVDEKPPTPREQEPEAILETGHLRPIILLDDLVPLGFDTTTLYAIEPHFHLLNGALITLAELKMSYDSSADANHRASLNTYAIPFHLTADMHQRAILNRLQPPLDSRFDKYIEDRKRAVGLSDWHVDHRQNPGGSELPGLVPTPRRPAH